MTRSDLRPLSKESVARIEWVRAQHEVRIRRVLLDWHTQAERVTARPTTLTMQQQTELQALLVAMSVQLGKTEGRERLSTAPIPDQFEIEIRCLLEIVAFEARDRWNLLTSAFHLEASAEGEYPDAECEIYCRVRELLELPSERLILQAWSAYKKQRRAECKGNGRPAPLSATPPADVGPGPVAAGSRAPADRSETLGQKVGRLGIDKGMAIGKLAAVAESSKVESPAISGADMTTATGHPFGEGQRPAAQNTAAPAVKSGTPTQRDTKQRPGKSRKGDASLLGDKTAVSIRTAEQYLGIGERQRQNLVSSGALKTEGQGHNQKLTTDSLRAYLPPENPN
jgi:hypothetical protein